MLLKDPAVRVKDVARRFGVSVATLYNASASSRRKLNQPMADRYHDRLKILEDQEIEELYARPQFNHEESVHFFSLSPEARALADGHYNLANRVLFILQAGYFKARTLFFSFDFEDVRADVQHVLSIVTPALTTPSLPHQVSNRAAMRNMRLASWFGPFRQFVLAHPWDVKGSGNIHPVVVAAVGIVWSAVRLQAKSLW